MPIKSKEDSALPDMDRKISTPNIIRTANTIRIIPNAIALA
jgi:hypothetical protein